MGVRFIVTHMRLNQKHRLAVLLFVSAVATVGTCWVTVPVYFGVRYSPFDRVGGWEWDVGILTPFDVPVDSESDDWSSRVDWSWVLLERKSPLFPYLVSESLLSFVPVDYYLNDRLEYQEVRSIPRQYINSVRDFPVVAESGLDEILITREVWFLSSNFHVYDEGGLQGLIQRDRDYVQSMFDSGRLIRDRHRNHWSLRYGFPLPSMIIDYSQYIEGPADPIRAGSGIVIGSPVEMVWGTVFHVNNHAAQTSASFSVSAEPALPTRIIWSGFLVNTVFNAIVLSGLWFTGKAGVGVLHRRRGRRRLSRGVCPECRYDLSGGMACPECGWMMSEKGSGAAGAG